MSTTKRAAQEAHVYWISLEDIKQEYALWKAVPPRKRGRAAQAPVVQIGQVDGIAPDPEGAVEFEFPASALEEAFAELAARKSTKDEYGDLTYGEAVPVGRSGITLERQERHLYEIWVPCGEYFEIRAGALRALVAAVRDLGVSTVDAA